MLPHTIVKTLTNLSTKPNFEQALSHYSTAAEGNLPHSAMAMFNLGWMYEHGLGVNRDFYLAKRYYDLALATNPGAYLPVQIATSYLHVKWVLTDFLGYVFGRDSYTGESAIYTNGNEDEDDDEDELDLEGLMVLVGVGVLTLLIYLRGRMLA
jgi:tetratricopeptide (TPR) repeat protein